jgi:hypothetical protein
MEEARWQHVRIDLLLAEAKAMLLLDRSMIDEWDDEMLLSLEAARSMPVDAPYEEREKAECRILNAWVHSKPRKMLVYTKDAAEIVTQRRDDEFEFVSFVDLVAPEMISEVCRSLLPEAWSQRAL